MTCLMHTVRRAGWRVNRGTRTFDRGPAPPWRPFAALGDLFSELPADVVAALPAPQQQALSAALFEGDAEPGSGPQALPRAVLGVLRGLAAGGPLLVAIDDEQWLDRPSARVLAFALCRLRSERVGVLLSRRPDGESALWPQLAHAFGGAGVAALVLEPLEAAALQRLVAARCRRPIARAQLRRICEVSGGNPLY